MLAEREVSKVTKVLIPNVWWDSRAFNETEKSGRGHSQLPTGIIGFP